MQTLHFLFFVLILNCTNAVAQFNYDSLEAVGPGSTSCLERVYFSNMDFIVNDSIIITDTNYMYIILNNAKTIKKRHIEMNVSRKKSGVMQNEKIDMSYQPRDQFKVYVKKKYLEQLLKRE